MSILLGGMVEMASSSVAAHLPIERQPSEMLQAKATVSAVVAF